MSKDKPFSFSLTIEAEFEQDLKAFMTKLRDVLYQSPGVSGTIKKTVKEKFDPAAMEFASFFGFGLDAPETPMDTAIRKEREREQPTPRA
jgi:hypothetical protein